MDGGSVTDFGSAMGQVQTELTSGIDTLVPIVATVAVAAIALYLIPWGIRKLRAAFSKAS